MRRYGGLKIKEMKMTIFDMINQWADDRKLLSIEWDKNTQGSFIAEELSEFLRAKTDNEEIDALCDIIVFCTNAIRLKGYDPNIAMAETLREIESRTGTFNNQTGKWEKDKTPEAMAFWYTAQYLKARL